MSNAPLIFWFRRDFRLSDHPGLANAIATKRPIIPVFIHDELTKTLGAAPKWRLGLAVAHFASTLNAIGSRLILRRGNALDVLQQLVLQTGAQAVHWSRAYDPDAIARDTQVKSALTENGIEAHSHTGHLLFEPWKVTTKTGGYYKVFTPMWKAVRTSMLPPNLPDITNLPPPDQWPDSDTIDSWNMAAGMDRGAAIVGEHVCVGARAAQNRLSLFMEQKVAHYTENRNFPATDATSRLSENLTYGEISPLTCWNAGWQALRDGKSEAETFLKELVWREFAYHLAFHTPHILTQNWNPKWQSFPWRGDGAHVLRWKQGRTGVQMVDAAMREMYVTGTMHNRARMIAASYLTKHLMTDWRVGQNWFAQCLTDWDPAANAMGWQWTAGCGPDAAPYFRIFNPDTQGEKFDKNGDYRRTFIAELSQNPARQAVRYFQAIPKQWALDATAPYPEPSEPLAIGRQNALAAYQNHRA